MTSCCRADGTRGSRPSPRRRGGGGRKAEEVTMLFHTRGGGMGLLVVGSIVGKHPQDSPHSCRSPQQMLSDSSSCTHACRGPCTARFDCAVCNRCSDTMECTHRNGCAACASRRPHADAALGQDREYQPVRLCHSPPASVSGPLLRRCANCGCAVGLCVQRACTRLCPCGSEIVFVVLTPQGRQHAWHNTIADNMKATGF